MAEYLGPGYYDPTQSADPDGGAFLNPPEGRYVPVPTGNGGMTMVYLPYPGNGGSGSPGGAGIPNMGTGAKTAATGASALAGWKGKLVDALPLIGGLLFGSKGPFSGGQMSGLSGVEPELQQILDLMRQRMEAQNPLFSAANQGAYNLLPNSAKQGNMFALPSSTGGR